MKKPLMLQLLTSITLTMLLLVTGCQTSPNGNPDQTSDGISPDRVYKVTRLAAYGSAIGMTIQNPGSGAALGQARDGFCAMKEAENWDLTQAMAIANAHGLQLLGSSEGQIILSGIPLMVDLFTDQNYDLRSQPYAVAVINGTCDGLTLALGPTARDVNAGEVHARLKAEAEATRPILR